MKNKSIALFLFVMLLTFSLLGCNGKGITDDEAKAHINDFFKEIEAGDYEKAETYLHLERPASLQEYLNTIETDNNLNFKLGIKVEKYTNFSYSIYDSTVQGSTYTLDMKTMVGDAKLGMSIEIVRNENGYGIYNFDIKP